MKKLNSAIAIAVFSMVISPFPSIAHHSFMAEFDERKPFTVTGVVTRIDWENPHAFFYLDAKDEGGRIVKWSFQTATPIALTHRGWKRESVKVGDRITVRAYLAKRGSNFAAARSIVMPNGRTVFTGSMDDGGPDR
jgi:hypothetical protein